MRIILASGSPRRRQLLAQAGIEFEVVVSDADETISGAPDAQVAALAERKARATLDLLNARGDADNALIIAADTLVAIEDATGEDGYRVLSKPADAAEAYAMLSTLQGCMHTVYTGVAILRTPDCATAANGQYGADAPDDCMVFVEATDVFFRPLTEREIHAYIATGEPFDKAGAYGIQEKGALLVERVDGDFYTVMGLPVARLCAELDKLGVPVWGA